MRKVTIFGLILMLLILGSSPVVLAHDGWVQTNTPIIEPGEVSYVELLFGNHSNDHASYRIEGTWNPDDTDVHVTTPSGEKVNIADTLFYTGEIADGITNNYYIASFSSTSPGMYTISAERDSVFAHGGVETRTLRSAKTYVAVSEYPMVSAVQSFEHYDQQITPDRAELIPRFNPVAVTTNEEVSVQLLQQGEPLADAEVVLIRRSTAEAERFQTDADGVITFTTGPADYYLLRAMPTVEGTNYEATMTFTVQNGSGLNRDQDTLAVAALPAGAPVQEDGLFRNPFVYLSLLLGAGWLGTIIRLWRRHEQQGG